MVSETVNLLKNLPVEVVKQPLLRQVNESIQNSKHAEERKPPTLLGMDTMALTGFFPSSIMRFQDSVSFPCTLKKKMTFLLSVVL